MLFVFIISILFPIFGKLRTYYLYKPIYLLRSYSILENNRNLPIFSFISGSKAFILKNNFYYELGEFYSIDDTGGIVVTFDHTQSKKDWD